LQTNLESLARQELELLSQLPTHGHFEGLQPIIEAAGLPAKWSSIIDEYARFLSDRAFGTEALRRAVFLVWYRWNEPWQLTGIRDAEPKTELSILRALEAELRSSNPDLELQSMLSGYGPGLPFDQHPEFTAIQTCLAAATGRCYPDVRLPSLETRGAMGRYWLGRSDLPNKPLQPTSGGQVEVE
jgi:hypothetical protein